MVRAAVLLSLVAGCATRAPTVHTWTSGEAGFHTNTTWVDTGREVVVFDAQFTPDLAELALADIRAATDSPVRWLVITHPNPDKFNGAEVFRGAGAQVVASRATVDAMPGVHAYKEAFFVGAGMFDEGSYPALPEIDIVFDEALALTDGVELRVLEHAGVTSTQTVGLVDAAHLVVGDLAANRTHAWLEGSVAGGAPDPDVAGWLDALEEVRALLPEGTLHAGRGAPLPVEQAIDAQVAYLRSVEGIVDGYVAGIDAAELSGPDAGAHWGAITEQVAAAWPDHAHPYLVTYGVYGLALELAR